MWGPVAGLPEEEARGAFRVLPENCVRSMAEWVCFVLRMVGRCRLTL